MNKLHMLRFLCTCFFMLLTTISCNNSGNEISSASNIGNDDLSASTSESTSTVKDVVSASIVVNEVWIRDANEKGFEEQLLLEPKEVRLVPASGDNAEMLVDLVLPAGEYDQVRLVLGSGTVTLSDNVYVSNGHLFSTDLGNLKFPSGYQSGIKEKIEPSIEVVTGLSQELVLHFELADSFVFNGPATHAPGVKSVLFKPVIRTVNNSTHGRITLSVSGSDRAKCSVDPIAGAVVTAIDTSGVSPDVSTTTNTLGEAVIKLLPGIYDILIEEDGFEPLTVENNQVYVANATKLGDVQLEVGTDDNPTAFNRERATLLAVMANIAYASSDNTRGYDTTVDTLSPGEVLPHRDDEWKETFDEYLGKETHKDKDTDKEFGDRCWTFVKFIETGLDTQLFVTKNEGTGDLVVSFRGTAEGLDFLLDASVVKIPWDFRDEELKVEGLPAPIAVHSGFSLAYFSVADDLVATLSAEIAKVADKSEARVYFTGHSLGGALSTLAALDLSDWLVGKGYARTNVIMYSFGAPRSITTNLRSSFWEYEDRVPHGIAVAAKDDYITHLPARNSIPPIAFPYTHIGNLTVLNSDIQMYGEGSRYLKLGDTRIEDSRGNIYKGCGDPSEKVDMLLSPFFWVGLPAGSVYERRGHDQLQYITRLNNIVSNGKPLIALRTSDKRLVLSWTGGAQGPCDWIGVFAVDKDDDAPPKDSGDYIKFRDARQWAVQSDACPFGSTDPAACLTGSGINRQHVTNKNPNGIKGFGDCNKVFYAGYVDGFGRIIKTWRRTKPAGECD